MNELAARISRLAAAACALVVFGISCWSGAGLAAVALRSAVAFCATWIVCDLLARRVLRTLLLRAVAERRTSKIDITLH